MKVSAIVPAYNEEKKIGHVLDTLTKCKSIDEVICVNDGSSDKTAEIAKSYKKVVVIELPKNCGKAYAVMQGVIQAKGDIILFIDADLVGLTASKINSLIDPLKEDTHDAAIGYKLGSKFDIFFIPLGGERAYFKKDILPLAEHAKDKGFGLELYLNYAFKEKRVKLLGLRGVSHTLKHVKYSYRKAATNTVTEIVDIISEIFKQRNPVKFFIHAYLYPFYIKQRVK
ncbi:MAG TPA: glycosyltransferase family 2 protein [Candidatus Acidoferrales bacterium]|nr:glycosyltransferase family 2 protein [Candidatus Acidoferrales bacterium]